MTDTAPRRRPRGRRPPTIIDVTEHAGVSRGTVSRVLQGGHNVSPAAREAVNAAIRKLGYVVNRAARSLVTQRAGSVAFLLSETHVDGVLLVSSHRGNPMIDHLRRADLPFVCCGKPLGERGALSYVASDDHEGARTMVRYLLESGRRRIATITGPQDTPGGLERLQGYREMLAERGIAFDERLVAHGDYSRASGETGMQRLLTTAPDLDAVFAASDLMADGARLDNS
ncbi:LacI family DNA-binding transcriptional regulator [Lentzea rhizosphaerae]|uniref:LacI family DNA-binding transcriptional regulator n=1 Tax=Lentzea rhizosphaerae TaxID=2041025 RepID=A0ABV8BLN0_9PSEU